MTEHHITLTLGIQSYRKLGQATQGRKPQWMQMPLQSHYIVIQIQRKNVPATTSLALGPAKVSAAEVISVCHP